MNNFLRHNTLLKIILFLFVILILILDISIIVSPGRPLCDDSLDWENFVCTYWSYIEIIKSGFY